MPTSGQFVVGELVTASDANSLFVRGYQNRIINGAFVINQRAYTSGTNLASGSYGFDRWKSGYTNTALTFTAGSQSTTVTISTSGVLQQIVERENMPAGTYVLSWSGTATGRVYNSGGTPPAYAASPVTVTLDGLANVVVEFTASGATKTLGTVQLEGGTVFSPFEYRQRGDELLLCYRYFTRLVDPPGAATGHPTFTASRCNYALPVPMRAIPNLTTNGTFSFWNGATAATATTASASFRSRFGVEIDWSGSTAYGTGVSVKSYTTNGTNYIDCEAEL
jgi:hypothetical protein